MDDTHIRRALRLRSSLRAALRVWQTTAQRMEGILDDESLTEREMLNEVDAEVRACEDAMDTLGAEIEGALG